MEKQKTTEAVHPRVTEADIEKSLSEKNDSPQTPMPWSLAGDTSIVGENGRLVANFLHARDREFFIKLMEEAAQ